MYMPQEPEMTTATATRRTYRIAFDPAKSELGIDFPARWRCGESGVNAATREDAVSQTERFARYQASPSGSAYKVRGVAQFVARLIGYDDHQPRWAVMTDSGRLTGQVLDAAWVDNRQRDRMQMLDRTLTAHLARGGCPKHLLTHDYEIVVED